MFSHYVTHKISPICKISTFSEDLSFLNPRNHLKCTKKKKRKKERKKVKSEETIPE